MAKQPKCQHCEAAISPEPTDAGAWYHLWSGLTKCLKIRNKEPLGTFATPRVEK